MPSTASLLDKQLLCLVSGFDALQDEYQRIWNRCQTLERSLETAKTQYSALTSQCPHKAEPLVLPDSPLDTNSAQSGKALIFSRISDLAQRDKITAACRLSEQMRTTARTASSNSVTIHSGPSADKVSAPGSSAMPSISESPLEQDFTVAGTPSKLDCPFASMANRKLSSHAASVVSRYRPDSATPRSSVSRVNGRASSVAQASLTDPIKVDTCGLALPVKPQDLEASASAQGSTRVCPIRFMDQHSPEEVAAYFESHKHELPRSHEVCVQRYQSNEESIKQLDAKYGNLVSMIQGLGQKHVSLLPDEIAENGEETEDDHLSAEKIRKWASSVDSNAAELTPPHEDESDDDERQHRFDRPLKDVRLGESPSRPWGIQVPIHVDRRGSYASSVAAHAAVDVNAGPVFQPKDQAANPPGKCPFGFDAPEQKPSQAPPASVPEPQSGPASAPAPGRASEPAPEPRTAPTATFLNASVTDDASKNTKTAPQMIFTGPVFIGYSLDDAMKLLQQSQRYDKNGL